MGEPLFEKKDIPMKGEGICRLETIEALGRSFTISAVNTGVPHIAVFGEVTEEDILKYGPALEKRLGGVRTYGRCSADPALCAP